jgi:glyoxylase I family protein
MGLVTGIHHVSIRTTDFERSIAFYTEGLGMQVVLRWGEGDGRAAMLDAGNENYVELFAGGAADPAPDKRMLHLALRTDDVDAALAAAVQAGAVTTIEPEDVVIPGQPAEATVRIAFCTGLDNEVIEFIQSTAGSIP